MNDVGTFSRAAISHGAEILAANALMAIAGVYGTRRLRDSGTLRFETEMMWRTVFNAFVFLLALAFFYQGMEISTLHTTLVELNAPYYEGGQGASPVASEGDLRALHDLANRALVYALLAFLLLLAGCGLQYLSTRRHRRSSA